jgi:gas vesicle protein
MADEKQGGNLGWFLLGLGVGAAVGVLYAPKAGSETRDELLEQARERTEYVKHKSRKAADQMGDLIESGKGHVHEYVDKGKHAVERGREQWDAVVDRGRHLVSEQADRVNAAVDAGKHAYKATTATTATTAAPANEDLV